MQALQLAHLAQASVALAREREVGGRGGLVAQMLAALAEVRAAVWAAPEQVEVVQEDQQLLLR